MSESTEVRAATRADIDQVVAYNAAMAQLTEGRDLPRERLRRGVAAVLDDTSKGRYLLAQRGQLIVGQLLLTYEWSDWRAAWFWWIQSVFVAPEARRTGVYRALYAAVLAEARAARDVAGIRLYVERENERAQQTYHALGMSETAYRLFEVDWADGGAEEDAEAGAG